MKSKQLKYPAAFTISAIFFFILLFTLKDYGINWDSPVRLLRGNAYLDLFLGQTSQSVNSVSPILFKPGEYITRFDFLAQEGARAAHLPQKPLFNSNKTSFYNHPAWNAQAFIDNEHQSPGHYPLPEIVGAVFNKIFYQSLNVLGDIESYQLFSILTSLLGVFFVFLFTYEILENLKARNPAIGAAIAAVTLALFPIFFAESHFNIKDPPQASFYIAAVWSFWHFVKDNQKRYLVLLSTFTALALSVKWNIIFFPIIASIWLLSIRKTLQFKTWFKPKKLIVLFLLSIGSIFLFLTVIYPPAWENPLGIFLKVVTFYKNLGLSPNHIQPDGFIGPLGLNFYPPVLLFAQLPSATLIFLALGIFSVFKNRKNDRLNTGLLLLLWLSIPLLRTILPNVKSYSGIRQIFEVLPAIAILAGLGANYLMTNDKWQMANRWKIKNVKWQILVATLILSLITFYLSLINYTLHPNQNVYFNAAVGGIKGAQRLNLIDLMVSYGNVYKQAVIWLNQNAQKDANLAILDGYTFAASPLWLRSNISLSPYHFSGFLQNGEYIFSLYRTNEEPVFSQLYPKRFLKPVHTIAVDNVPLLFIYKNSAGFLLPGKTEAVQNNPKVRVINLLKNLRLEVDLGRELKVTRIIVSTPTGCSGQTSSAYIDELIAFQTQGANAKIVTYGLNEKWRSSKNTVEIWFPAQPARKITITPKSATSCFLNGKITAVKYLP